MRNYHGSVTWDEQKGLQCGKIFCSLKGTFCNPTQKK
jgi:hypothetical protein